MLGMVVDGRLLRHARTVLLGRPLHGPERYAPFSIVGSGRCGTTLMRAVLQANPTVHIPPENVMLRPVIHQYRRYDRLPWWPLLRILLGNMAFHESWEAYDLPLGPIFRDLAARPPHERHLAAILDAVYRGHMKKHKPKAVRWGDKSAFNVLVLEELRMVFPDIRIIHMLRDGRDVAASIIDAFGTDLSHAARAWLRAVEAAQSFGKRHPEQYLEVRYEDFVGEPESTARRVTSFLGLEFDDRMLRHHELNLKLGDVERIPYMQGVRRAVHRTSVGRWRRSFDTSQQAELQAVLGPTLARLGYTDGP